jgi:hypothetical protein
VLYDTVRPGSKACIAYICALPSYRTPAISGFYHYMGIADQTNVRCKAKLSLVTSRAISCTGCLQSAMGYHIHVSWAGHSTTTNRHCCITVYINCGACPVKSWNQHITFHDRLALFHFTSLLAIPINLATEALFYAHFHMCE